MGPCAHEQIALLALVDHNFDHLHWLGRTITAVGRRALDLLYDVEARGDLAKDWMTGVTWGEPVEVRIMTGIDEELAAAAVGHARVRHRQSTGLVRDFCIFWMLVADAAIGAVSGASARALRIAAVWAAKLDHEVFNHTVEVQAVVKAALCQLNEVSSGHGHFVDEELDRKFAFRGSTCRSGVGHRCKR